MVSVDDIRVWNLRTLRVTTPATQHEVEQFLFAEAELLDDHRYDEWIRLFTDDAHYWMPSRKTLTMREREGEVSARGEGAHIDDDMKMLRGRVRRITSGTQWSEEPPSRTRRLLSNVRVSERQDGDFHVRTNFCVYRSRRERQEDWFVGERFDLLRRSTGPYPYQIAHRKIVLEQTTVLAPSISIFL